MMKSYLSLVGISSHVRKKKSVLTVFVIALAVFLVTVIFSMADMYLLAQRIGRIRTNGDWHAGFSGITLREGTEIAARPEVTKAGWYDSVWGTAGYRISGKELYISGIPEEWLGNFNMELKSGRFPQNDKEAALTETAARLSGFSDGETVTVTGPDGREFEVMLSGIVSDTVMLLQKDGCGMLMTPESIRNTFPEENVSSTLFTKFSLHSDILGSIGRIRQLYGISEKEAAVNEPLLATFGQTDDPSFLMLYAMAGVLSLLVLTAGILMISGSFSALLSEKVRFYGLLGCLGATRRQIRRYVYAESLRYCLTGVPAGTISGIAVTWLLCGLLKGISPTYFADMPLFSVSLPGFAAGLLMGPVTVLLSSLSPAKKAAQIPPVGAVSGGAEERYAFGKKRSTGSRRVSSVRRAPIHLLLGLHHAVGSRRKYALVVMSMAFSVILFLSFTPLVDFMHQSLRPLRPWSPDITISAKESEIPVSLAEELAAVSGVKKAYGRMYLDGIKAGSGGGETEVSLISYEKNQFGWAAGSLLQGSLLEAEEGGAALVLEPNAGGWRYGDLISLNIDGKEKQVQVGGVLNDSPFDQTSAQYLVIVSEKTFRELTGKDTYDVLDLQLERKAGEGMVDELRAMTAEFGFSDRRSGNEEVRALDAAFKLFVYGFLVVIAMISVVNMVNSVTLSVSSRMTQYGMMRAVGLEYGQTLSMIIAESFAYAGGGCLIGCLAGLCLHRFLFRGIVQGLWQQTAYRFPAAELIIILFLMLASTAVAVRRPAKKIRDMDVVELVRGL